MSPTDLIASNEGLMPTFAPTPSYEVDLPEDAQTDIDELVTSIWRPDSDLAIQLSSAVRYEGAQIDAGERLRDRIEGNLGPWRAVDVALPLVADADVAAAQITDEHGYDWLHVYITWPDLSIYVTVSGPSDEAPFARTWVMSVLRSIRRRGRRGGDAGTDGK